MTYTEFKKLKINTSGIGLDLNGPAAVMVGVPQSAEAHTVCSDGGRYGNSSVI